MGRGAYEMHHRSHSKVMTELGLDPVVAQQQ